MEIWGMLGFVLVMLVIVAGAIGAFTLIGAIIRRLTAPTAARGEDTNQ